MGSRDIGVSPPRHVLWYKTFLCIGRAILLPPVKLFLRIKTKKDKGEKELPCILVYNHFSNYDYITSVDVFRPYARYIISDAMLRSKFNAIVFPIATDFIYRRKGDKADDAVKSVEATIKAGVCVGLSPEGGVSGNGTTESIRPRTGQMVKDCDCALITMTMHGSYFIYPNWSHYKAKGPMFCEIVGRYTREQIRSMTVDEINEAMARDLYVNHYEWNREKRIPYRRKHRAEWMEKVAGVCPKCKAMDTMHSDKDDFYCENCGYKLTVDEYGFFQGEDVVFDNLYDWDMWQREYLSSQRQKWLDNPDEMITYNDHLRLSVLKDNFPVVLDEDVRIEMTAREIRVIGEKENMTFPLDEVDGITGAIANGFGITYKNEYYQFKATQRPLWNMKQRYIRKVLRGEPIGKLQDGRVV